MLTPPCDPGFRRTPGVEPIALLLFLLGLLALVVTTAQRIDLAMAAATDWLGQAVEQASQRADAWKLAARQILNTF